MPGSAGLRQAGYELVRRLGKGGMGEVWAAAKLGVEGAIKPCAIKVIRPDYADDARYRELFVAEGRLAMMLGHSCIVSVFDVGVVGRMLFMAMEWIDGVDLNTFRRQVQLAAGGQALSIVDAAHITGALLDALGYAHGFRVGGCEHGIVHRDVSPRNVMITSRGEVKLMDFGLAGLQPDRGQGPGPRLRGTLRYLSREQARGRPEAASDLFAVGAILHELLDGRRFRHEHDDESSLVASIFDEGIPRLARRVPPVIDTLRRGLLEPRAELRFRTARRALATLAKWPGYRNRRLQLESLYRQVIGEPRSGLTQLLSLGFRSDLLDELQRRAQTQRTSVVQPRDPQRTVPWAAAPRAEATAAEAARTVRVEASIVRARTPARVEAHRVAASSQAREEPADDLEQETTDPWPGRGAGSQVVPGSGPDPDVEPATWCEPGADESATAWLSSAVDGPGPTSTSRVPSPARWPAVLRAAWPWPRALPSLLARAGGHVARMVAIRRALWPAVWVLLGGLMVLVVLAIVSAKGDATSSPTGRRTAPAHEVPR
ncbi:MAG: serine/threonine-protein kinase [Nannocystaceae bacterium]